MTNADQSKECNGIIRILSLDGGGARGLLSAQILKNMEAYLNITEGKNQPLAERFDLITGTSIGAFIALSLAIGKSAEEIFSYLNGKPGKRGKIYDIFDKPQGVLSWLWKQSKYSANPLKDALNERFGESKLSDIDSKKIRVLITSASLAKPSLRTWKNAFKPEFAERANRQLADIAYASAAAPTFFPPQTEKEFDAPLVDGGICANNPAVAAIVEAVGLGYDLQQIHLVSVGTGIPGGMPYDPNTIGNKGALRWLVNRKEKTVPLIELMFQSQADMTHRQAEFLLKKNNGYLRINPQLKFPMSLDDTKKLNLLSGYADLDQKQKAKLKTLIIN